MDLDRGDRGIFGPRGAWGRAPLGAGTTWTSDQMPLNPQIVPRKRRKCKYRSRHLGVARAAQTPHPQLQNNPKNSTGCLQAAVYWKGGKDEEQLTGGHLKLTLSSLPAAASVP